MKTGWVRVSRSKRCPICGHDSWCTYTESVALCMRVQSNRPKTLKGGETGWIHSVNGESRPVVEKERPAPVINVGKLISEWSRTTKGEWVRRLSEKLGVTQKSLACLECCWATPHKAWAFPMRDGRNNYSGIRLRSESGKKWAVPGSHQGIFLPQNPPQSQVVICEGPTDAAAAISLGFFAVGRPSCSGGMQDIITFIREHGIRRAVVVSDNDSPGWKGAQMLMQHLPIPCCEALLPAKDMREFVRAGGTASLFDSIIKTRVWKQPQ